MEVKNIFMNLIMRTYERQHASNANCLCGGEVKNGAANPEDAITISETATRRFFRDIMENSLQKGLNEVMTNENI
ncbi:MAG TPA: hypothetical protein PLS81_07505 [Deltaproteobacteria bacterium]|nr:hypothetical protein [Deltaproteobacteria bacterium]HOM29288.1 hypothetical protein [Deltaproteobacteria bacterium]HPP80705.1 hypothetical protein [Deltaproteobacteria bacterium]